MNLCFQYLGQFYLHLIGKTKLFISLHGFFYPSNSHANAFRSFTQAFSSSGATERTGSTQTHMQKNTQSTLCSSSSHQRAAADTETLFPSSSSSLTLHSAPPSHRLCCCFPLPFPYFIFLPLISWAVAWSINRHPRSQPSIERERAHNNRVREDKRQEEHKYRQQVLITRKRLTTQSGKTSWNLKNALKNCVCACTCAYWSF